MKKLLLILCVALVGYAFASCDKDDDNGKLDPNAKIYIQGVDKALKNSHLAVDAPMTAHDICQLESVYLHYMSIDENGEGYGALWFGQKDAPYAIDTTNNRLVMKAGNIDRIDDNQFLTAEYCYITDRGDYDGDTIAYVPKAQLEAAYEQIKALWDTENWDAIYEIFQNAFTFIPCTGEEYKALKEQGLN